tara:strand:- start:67 stop:417 length:351 start_codon:yes stop_codon:yes gene_type:complete
MSKVTSIESFNKIKRFSIDNDYIIFDAPTIAFNDWNIEEGTILNIDIYTEKPSLKKTKDNCLELFGYIFKTFSDYSFFSAGGFLAKLPNSYTIDSKLYIVITDKPISHQKSKRSKI